MVARHDKHLLFSFRQLRQQMVKQLHRLGRGDSAVIYISRDDDGVRRAGIDSREQLFDPVCLIRQDQRYIVQHFAEVEIGNVEKFHVVSPLACGFARSRIAGIRKAAFLVVVKEPVTVRLPF